MSQQIERGKPRPLDDCYRILVLDDNTAQMEKIRLACRQLDQEVVAVTTIRDGFAFLDTKDHVDVVIAEAFLQHESCFDLLIRMRQMPEHEKVPVMIVAVSPGEIGRFCSTEMEGTARLLGAYKFLVMPEFDLDLLMREIATIVPNGTTPRRQSR